MNETEIAEESGKTHDYTQEWVYLGIRKDGKALNRGHALMHMLTWKYIIIAHTKASIEGIPPKNIKDKNRHNMETNNEQTDHKNTRNTTQDRKSENKKRSEARRILTLQYE